MIYNKKLIKVLSQMGCCQSSKVFMPSIKLTPKKKNQKKEKYMTKSQIKDNARTFALSKKNMGMSGRDLLSFKQQPRTLL
jgi:hypothetical protein